MALSKESTFQEGDIVFVSYFGKMPLCCAEHNPCGECLRGNTHWRSKWTNRNGYEPNHQAARQKGR